MTSSGATSSGATGGTAPTAVADAPPAAPAEPTGSRLDAWWARTLSTPARRRAWDIGGPALVVLIAAILRLWDLGHPRALVFDETYYVKDAWTLSHLGYEGSWPTDANTAFQAGDPNGFLPAPSFIAHPPLGKWVIALGELALGGGNPWGWRISTAIVGILVVLLLMLIAKGVFRSTLIAVLAGGLMAIDGNAIVMSRVALLDGILTLFVLLAFGALLLDRWWTQRRTIEWIARRRAAGSSADWGPALWWRPWLIAAGIALGAATSVKWNGVYFLAFFAVYTVVSDVLLRRRQGVSLWFSGTVFKQGPVTFLLMVPAAALVYVTSWTGWFASDGGYYRHWAEETNGRWTGGLSWVPLAVQNWWHYQNEIYRYDIGESRPHSYAANPLTWLLMMRPTSMYYQGDSLGQNGCTADLCGQSITGIANPIIWYAGVLAAFYLLYRLIRYREWWTGFVLLGVAAGYLPWLQYLHRTVFQFYTIAFEPYLVLALVGTLGILLGSKRDPVWRRVGGIRIVGVFLAFAVAVSAFFLPLWFGTQVPWWFIQLHYWLPGWR